MYVCSWVVNVLLNFGLVYSIYKTKIQQNMRLLLACKSVVFVSNVYEGSLLAFDSNVVPCLALYVRVFWILKPLLRFACLLLDCDFFFCLLLLLIVVHVHVCL